MDETTWLRSLPDRWEDAVDIVDEETTDLSECMDALALVTGASPEEVTKAYDNPRWWDYEHG